MLTAADALRTAGRRRPPPSLTQLYHEYVMQRIEAFKNSVTRDEFMRLAGEATAGLYDSDESQLVLTELLMGEVVDPLIRKKLKLKTQKKFGEHVLKLRAAQKEPTHWGLDERVPGGAAAAAPGPDRPRTRRGPGCRGVRLPPRRARSGRGLLGLRPRRRGAAGAAAGDRVAGGAVLRPDGAPSATGCHPAPIPSTWSSSTWRALAELDSPTRFDALRALQSQTNRHGLHVLLPSTALVPEAVFTFYDGWEREETPRRKRGPRPAGCILVKPAPAEHRKAAGA